MTPFARTVSLALLAAALPLAGCGMLGEGDKKVDGESVGYACRVSGKLPEDCMKENETYTPTSILEGWKSADKDVKERKIDPSMGKSPPAPAGMAEMTKESSGGETGGVPPVVEEKPAAEQAQVTH